MDDPPVSGPGGLRLIDHVALEWTSVVANCTMNRERVLDGGNGYGRELGVEPLAFLKARLGQQEEVAWLDMCCGRGRALSIAAEQLETEGLRHRFFLHGVDLVGGFDRRGAQDPPDFHEASLHRWAASRSYDLITCIHGLHYLGDKLGALARAVGWLKNDGLLLAHLDLDSIRIDDVDARPWLGRALRRQGLTYNAQRRLVRGKGTRSIRWGLAYVGADPHAGPNYTGQPAVNAYYRVEAEPAKQ
ncbi:MAG: methyltransferase domain-containing protein [Bacteroidota bacterium]